MPNKKQSVNSLNLPCYCAYFAIYCILTPVQLPRMYLQIRTEIKYATLKLFLGPHTYLKIGCNLYTGSNTKRGSQLYSQDHATTSNEIDKTSM